MTPTEARALAAEARARGMSSIDSALRSLADQVEALQALHTPVLDSVLNDTIDRLRTENATLRELVREAMDYEGRDGKWYERAEKALTPQT
jgi:hypothetical protein